MSMCTLYYYSKPSKYVQKCHFADNFGIWNGQSQRSPWNGWFRISQRKTWFKTFISNVKQLFNKKRWRNQLFLYCTVGITRVPENPKTRLARDSFFYEPEATRTRYFQSSLKPEKPHTRNLNPKNPTLTSTFPRLFI